MDLLRKLAVEHDAAIIAVTHDDKIFDRFDRIFQLRDGQLEGGNRSGHEGTAARFRSCARSKASRCRSGNAFLISVCEAVA